VIAPLPEEASDVTHSLPEPNESLAVVLEDEPPGARSPDQQVSARKLGAPGGNETLRLRGEFIVVTSPPIDPLANGLRVVVTDSAGGTVFDTTLPGGFDPVTGAGWVVRGTRWRYASGDRAIKGRVKRRAAVPGQLLVSVSARRQTLSVAPTGRPLALRLDVNPVYAATLQCGELTFDPNACPFGGAGSRLTCR